MTKWSKFTKICSEVKKSVSNYLVTYHLIIFFLTDLFYFIVLVIVAWKLNNKLLLASSTIGIVVYLLKKLLTLDDVKESEVPICFTVLLTAVSLILNLIILVDKLKQ